jgi:hypothetical protein
VKPSNWPDSGPAGTSTAYAADYAMAAVKMHYDGNSWVGAGTRGNIRNAVAAWECGCGNNGNGGYANKVWEYLSSKPWRNSVGKPPYWF